MGKRQSMGAVFQRENKKKRYTQKLSKKTINEIKNRGKSERKPRTSFSTPGSRVGTTVHNESRDRVKAVLKKALTSNKPVSKAHLNQSLGGRAGSQTQRLKLKSYDTYKSNKGLTDSESARKSEFKRATSYQGMRLGETRKDLASGFYSNKKSEAERTKEKANVRKNIEKGYNKKAENSTASFLAGLTKSNKTIETASKALLDKKVDTSKVTKKGAYKAGDTVQELASYAIAPTEAAGEKLIAKGIEKSAAKILTKEVGRKEAKAALKKAIAKDAIKTGAKTINKGKKAEKAFTNIENTALKNVKDKAVRDAVRDAGKGVTSKQRFLARRGGDIAANTPFNAKYAIDRNTDKNGNVNWKGAAADYALNTGLDVGIGGGIDSITGKVRKVKATKAENIAQAEAKIKEGITKKAKARAKRAEARRLERETAKTENTINVGAGRGQRKKSAKTEIPKRRHEQTTMYNAAEGKKTAVRGKKGVRSASQYDAGEVVKGLSDRINKLEAEGKINKKTAKDRRKALAQAYENVTGRTGVVERSGQFSSISKKGLNEISDGTVNGRSLTFDRRFKGAVERIGKKAEEAPATKKLADKTYTAKVKKLAKAEQALDEQIANATGEQKSILQKIKDKVDSRRKAYTPESVSKGYESVENAEVKETINNAENELKSSDISKEREALLKQRNDIEQRVKEGKLDPEDAADDIGDIDERLDELEEAETITKEGESWIDGIPTYEEDIKNMPTTEEKLRERVAKDKEEFESYTSVKKNADEKHKRKQDDTITAENSPSMAEVDNVRNMNEPVTTHDNNLTETGKARQEQMEAAQNEKAMLEDEYGKEFERSVKADKEATSRQNAKELDEIALGKREAPPKPKVEPKVEEGVVGERPKKVVTAELNKGFTTFKRAFVNSMDFTEKYAKKFAKVNGDPEFAKRVSANVNNLRQASQQAAHSLEVEQLDIHGNKVGKGGYEICKDMKKRGTAEDVYEYLLLMHHADRVDNATKDIDNEVIKLNGKDADKRIFPDKTPEEAREEAKKIYDKYVEAGRKDEFMNDVQDVVRYFRNDLRSQMLSGVISEDTFRHYIDTYPNYIPTHRVGTGTATRPKVNAKSAVEYAAKGSDEKVLPLQNQMQISTTNTFTRSALNDVAKDIADMHNVPKEAYDFVTSNGIEPIDTMSWFDVNDGKLRWTDNGEWKEIDVDKNFLKDLEDSQKNYFSDSLIMKALTKGNAAFKALITSYSPAFMVRNFLRDVPEGWFQSQNTLLNMKNMPSGFKSILTNDDWYRAYIRQGGSHAQFVNPEELFNGEWKKYNPLKRLERLNEITEQIPRMAEFRAYLKKLGVTPQTATVQQLRQASLAAADVTVNFGRSGSIGRLINKSLVPFFNPAIQGTSKFVRVLTQDKSVKGYFKLLGKAATLGIAPAMLNDMMLADNKNYQKISDRDRAINYYVPLDADNPLAKLFGSKEVGAKDGEIFLKLPKARIMSVFGAGTQKVMGNLSDTSIPDLVGIANDQIGPVGWENNIFMQVYNAYNNKTWYGTPIENEGDQVKYLKDGTKKTKKMRERYDANTSSISIGFANALHKATGIDVSPKRLDYLIDSYTGVIGDVGLGYFKKAAQRGYFAKAFSTDSTTQSAVPTRYYKKLNDSETSNKALKTMGTWQDRISTVNKAIKNVQNSDSKNKAKEVRELTKIRNGLMQKALDGKTSKDPTRDIRKVADVLGPKKTFDMVASDSDKKVLKKYGKADDKFLNSYVAIKELSASKNVSKETKALAIASAKGGKKVAKAFGVTSKGKGDTKSAYTRAKEYLKNGGSVSEYKSMQKAVRGAKLEQNDYLGKAATLAKMGAKDRVYGLYDIEGYNVRRGRNLAALGISAKELEKHKRAAFGDRKANNAQLYPYINSLKVSREKKSVIAEGLAWWVAKYNNPYGKVNASAKQAADKKFKAKYSGGKSSDDGKAGPVPLKRGYQTENGKKKPNGKTIGSIGEKVALPTRSYKDWKKDAKTRTLPSMNAFGSRINDKTKTVQREKDKPLVIHKVTKNKDGSTDIKFANGEVWHNPEKKEKKDNTKLGTSGSGGGGRRGYRRGWRRYGRGGYGGRGGSGGGASTPSTPKLNLSPYATKSVPHRTIGIGKRSKSKAKEGLTKAQLKEIMKMAVKSDNKAKKTKTSSANPYKITKS